MQNEQLIEIFKRKPKNKKETVKWSPDEQDKVIDLKDVNKYKSLYNSIVKFAEDLSKDVIKNVEPDTGDVVIKETDKGDYVELYMFKQIVSLSTNYTNLKKQYGKIFEEDEYSDVDGEDCCGWVVKNFLNKFKSKGFKQEEYSDAIFNYVKEDKEDEFLYVQFDEGYDILSVGMKVYYRKSSVQESMDYDGGEPLMELFKRRKKAKQEEHEKKHSLPKRVQAPSKKTYEQEQIVKEIKDILVNAKKVLSKPEYKEFINHGVELAPFYLAMDMAASSMSNMELYDEYETGEDFVIVEVDLWDYTKCGARTHQDEGFDTHPVNDAVMKMCDDIREYVYKKYPHYDVEIEGDWDTYSIMLTLK